MSHFVSFSPPVALIAAPWLLMALALSGPFLVLLLVVVVAAVAAALIAGVAALAAAPYLLWRRHRASASFEPSQVPA